MHVFKLRAWPPKLQSQRKRNVLFNDALNTFYLRLYGVRHMVKDHSDSEKGNPLPHIGYSYRLTARVLLYASSHRQDNTYRGLCYTSRGALAGTRNSSMGPPHEGSIRQPMSERSTSELHPAPRNLRAPGLFSIDCAVCVLYCIILYILFHFCFVYCR